MSLWHDFQATEAVTEADYSFGKDFQRGEEFLESIKYEYGYTGEKEINEQADNSSFACYFWAKDNGSIEDGRMNGKRLMYRDLIGDCKRQNESRIFT